MLLLKIPFQTRTVMPPLAALLHLLTTSNTRSCLIHARIIPKRELYPCITQNPDYALDSSTGTPRRITIVHPGPATSHHRDPSVVLRLNICLILVSRHFREE